MFSYLTEHYRVCPCDRWLSKRGHVYLWFGSFNYSTSVTTLLREWNCSALLWYLFPSWMLPPSTTEKHFQNTHLLQSTTITKLSISVLGIFRPNWSRAHKIFSNFVHPIKQSISVLGIFRRAHKIFTQDFFQFCTSN